MKPRLTVVVPVHRTEGSERNTEECLESLAAQTLTALDVVMVVAGPPDGAPAALARRFTGQDPRFRTVRHTGEPTGPGALRNTGARHTYPHTAYLAFLGPGEVLLPRAYEDLTALLDTSGADFASGNVHLLGPDGRRSPHHPAGRASALRTHITEDRTLLSDTPTANKVFRRSFWERHELAFPPGELYDEAPLTLRAHFLADAVDVLPEHVCCLRRPPGTGARRPGVPEVHERFDAVESVAAFLADPARTRGIPCREDYDRERLTDGLRDLVEALPAAGPEVRTAFLERARGYLARVEPRLLGTLPVELRMRWYLIRSGHLDDLLRLLAHQQRNPAAFRVAGTPLRRRAVLPLDPPLGLPPGVTRLDRADFPVRARVQEAVWRDGALRLRGYAYIRNLAAPGRHSYLGTAVLTQGRRRILLPLRTLRMPQATLDSGQEQHCYDWSGFEVTLDPYRLRRAGRWQEGSWQVGVVIAAAGVLRTAALRPPATGSGASPQPHDTFDGVRITPGYPDGRLGLTVERVTRRLTGREPAGAGALDLTFRAAAGPAPVALRLTHQGTGAVVSFPVEAGKDTEAGEAGDTGRAGEHRPAEDSGKAAAPVGQPGKPVRPGKPGKPAGHTVRVLLDALAAARPARYGVPRDIAPTHTETWAAGLVLADGGTGPVSCDPGLAPLALPLAHGRELVVAAGPAGRLVLHDRTPQPYLDRVVWRADGTLLVAGVLPVAAPRATELVLTHTTHAAETAVPTTHDSGRFHCALPLAALPSPAGPLPLRAGHWALRLRERGAPGSPSDAPVRFAPSVFDGLPASRTVRGKPFTLDRREHDEVFLAAGATLPANDRGPYRRRVLRESHYPLHRTRPLRDAVLYNCFGGRAYGDSPRAVHEELVRRGMEAEHLWAVRDAQTTVPATARAVVVGSAEWHGALAHSSWVVTNTHLPGWFTRRQGQTVVQTWHGTPLKRIGADLAGTLCGQLAHLAPRPGPARQWSVLLSPNAHSTPVLRSALGFPGEPLECGLPRTDAFFAADRRARAAVVRARLSIPTGKKVVLYAPTPRDHLAYDAAHHRMHLPLDLDAARQALADDHVLLVRSHPLVADRLPAHHAPFAVDVTAYPDATELLLAADVLVTDYSSLAADFANTGRPMLFLTPDLPHYRDTLRGFTLDFEAGAPGPLLASTGELIDALGDLDAIARSGADAYARFRRAFCHRDDGGAAGRAADLLLR
ncbi:bifunctional glycosyltransferase/CDP-glycerol:glycerophosphate glycerophosphotransferase [Streptomyces pinistramenti]|uniref:bifunctional glycosyltransferase/CDP-glycerol:glycerophosphate glycerophosphotransferase n=1 Tax=Streptomyces pinistramenti TaxID=2884812 RepID=UPI001D076FC5|nr:CDP-glycerol glycerophosphotransferase family protein [Streptomyces pinistramenti]MCB5911732.1 bifunctional glycosyltransferase family 2 protein/CDP-glycerol:glycerophosphate glycerophosphotransferase [Streptomyces pinistramenti]